MKRNVILVPSAANRSVGTASVPIGSSGWRITDHPGVVAISLSEFASKTDEIFRCKKHTILLTISGHIYL